MSTNPEVVNGIPMVVPKAPAKLEQRRDMLAKLANLPALESDEEYAWAGQQGVALLTLKKDIKEYWKPFKAAADKLHTMLCNAETEMLMDVLKAEEMVSLRQVAYFVEQKRVREEEARRQSQIALEAQQKSLAVEAASFEQSGDLESADMVMREAETVTAPVVHAELPKATGTVPQQPWEWEWADASKLKTEYRCPPDRCPEVKKNINSLVKRHKDGAMAMAGEGAIKVSQGVKIVHRS